jgi:hypothetical protein
MTLVTGNQLKAARALVALDQQVLATQADVNVNTIRNMEARGAEPITSGAVTVRNVQSVLEAHGVEFLNHGQPGVRLRYITVACGACGLRVKVAPTETQIDSNAYVSTCKLAPERTAFDFGCPNLRAAVSSAQQSLRKIEGSVLAPAGAPQWNALPEAVSQSKSSLGHQAAPRSKTRSRPSGGRGGKR